MPIQSVVLSLTLLLLLITPYDFCRGAVAHSTKDCPNVGANADIESIAQIIQFRSLWPGFEQQRFPFAISNGSSTTLFGFGETEIHSAKVTFKPCRLPSPAMPAAFDILDLVTPPLNGLFDIRFLSQPGTDALSKLVSTHQAPLIQIKSLNDFGFPSSTVARTALHEGFHGIYQFSRGGFKIGPVMPRNFLIECRQNQVWANSVIAQNEVLNQSLTEADPSRLQSIWNSIRSMRRQLAQNASTTSCLDSLRFWERIEGTAHYIETEAAIQANLMSPSELRSEVEALLGQPRLPDNFFYASGSTLIRLAKSISVTNWSTQIDSGTAIDLIQ